MFNNYQKVCKLESPGNVGQSVILQVKLPKCRTALNKVEAVCHFWYGVMMVVAMVDVIVAIFVIGIVLVILAELSSWWAYHGED